MKYSLFILLLLMSFSVFAQKLQVIVNISNTATQITRDQLSDFYFKRSRQWSDGMPVRFFDRNDSSLRNSFLRNYLQRTSRQVDQFWIGQKFNTGDSAPTQIGSDSMIMNLVSRFPGGIGYVKEGAVLTDNVKVIPVSDI